MISRRCEAHDYLTRHMPCPAQLWSDSMDYPRSESDGQRSLYLARHNLTAFHREEQNLSLFGIWNEIYRIY